MVEQDQSPLILEVPDLKTKEKCEVTSLNLMPLLLGYVVRHLGLWLAYEGQMHFMSQSVTNALNCLTLPHHFLYNALCHHIPQAFFSTLP